MVNSEWGGLGHTQERTKESVHRLDVTPDFLKGWVRTKRGRSGGRKLESTLNIGLFGEREDGGRVVDEGPSELTMSVPNGLPPIEGV